MYVDGENRNRYGFSSIFFLPRGRAGIYSIHFNTHRENTTTNLSCHHHRHLTDNTSLFRTRSGSGTNVSYSQTQLPQNRPGFSHDKVIKASLATSSPSQSHCKLVSCALGFELCSLCDIVHLFRVPQNVLPSK